MPAGTFLRRNMMANVHSILAIVRMYFRFFYVDSFVYVNLTINYVYWAAIGVLLAARHGIFCVFLSWIILCWLHWSYCPDCCLYGKAIESILQLSAQVIFDWLYLLRGQISKTSQVTFETVNKLFLPIFLFVFKSMFFESKPIRGSKRFIWTYLGSFICKVAFISFDIKRWIWNNLIKLISGHFRNLLLATLVRNPNVHISHGVRGRILKQFLFTQLNLKLLH